MMRINLLPHREEKRKARRHQFWALSGMVTVLAGLIWFLGYTIINGFPHWTKRSQKSKSLSNRQMRFWRVSESLRRCKQIEQRPFICSMS